MKNEQEPNNNPIIYLEGDATLPVSLTEIPEGKKEFKIIIHICNDYNRWGKGFVMALSNRYPAAKDAYHNGSLTLGDVSKHVVTDGLIIVNMIAQHGLYSRNGVSPIRYDALQKCLNYVMAVSEIYESFNYIPTIHMPRIGTGLAGGTWDKIEPMIKETLTNKGFKCHVYDLPK